MGKEISEQFLTESIGSEIKRLVVFDFDGTLCETPLPTDDSKAIYKEKTGEDWSSNGWWSRSETLNEAIFDIPVIESVVSEYRKERLKSDTMVIMLTGRIKKLSKYVEKVLESKDLIFDGYYYNTGGSTLDNKIKTMNELLKVHPTITEVHLFDDREEHIPHFKAWGSKLKDIDFKITVVESGRH